MWFIFTVPLLIRHLWQFKTFVFLHWCLLLAILFFLRMFCKFHFYKKVCFKKAMKNYFLYVFWIHTRASGACTIKHCMAVTNVRHFYPSLIFVGKAGATRIDSLTGISYNIWLPAACIIKLITTVIYGFLNKLECLSLNTKLGWKRLPGTNTQAYYENHRLRL